MENSVINYCLNKFCPYIIVVAMLFLNSDLELWRGIVALLFCFYIDKFAFKAGYSVAYCEARGISLEDTPDDQ